MAVLESSVLGNLVLAVFVLGDFAFGNSVVELGGLEIAALQNLDPEWSPELPPAVHAVAAVQLRGATSVFARAALAVVGEAEVVAAEVAVGGVEEELAQDFAQGLAEELAERPHLESAGSSDAAGVNGLAVEAPCLD